jgi:hypothetical protein
VSTTSRTAGAAGSLDFTTRNAAGQLVTPVSTPVVTWYTDSGRTAGALALTVTGSGSNWNAAWTGPQAPATAASRYLKFHLEVSSGVFKDDVDDDISFVDASAVPGPTSLCTLAEVKIQLKQQNITANDVELQSYIDAVTAPIEDYCGPILPRQVTEWPDWTGGPVLFLDQGPLISVTSVTEYRGNVAYAYSEVQDPTSAGLYTFLVDPTLTGKITRIFNGGRQLPFTGPVKVVYQAGRTVVPANVNAAARLVVQALWRAQQSWGLSPDDPSAGDVVVATLRSPQVQMLLEAHRRLPGIA